MKRLRWLQRPSPWTYRSGNGLVHEGTAGRYTGGLDHIEVTDYRTTNSVDQDHIARHQPGRVLAECEAKRRIVEDHTDSREPDYCPRCVKYRDQWEGFIVYCPHPCPTLAALASVYADHPDYRDEWRP